MYPFFSMLIFAIVSKFLIQTRSRRKKLPPSQLPLPILGHLHLLKDPLHRTLNSLSKKHGSIYSLRFGSRRVFIVSSPSAVEECFNKNDIVFANRRHLIMGKYLGYNNSTLGLLPYGDQWRNLRRLSAVETFSSSRLNMFLGSRGDERNILIRSLYSVSRNDFAKIELRSMFSELTFSIIMRMVAGKRYYGEDGTKLEEAKQFRELIQEIFECAGASNPADFMPFLQWFDYQGYVKKAIRLCEKTDVFLQDFIDENRSNENGSESRNTMIGHLLSARIRT